MNTEEIMKEIERDIEGLPPLMKRAFLVGARSILIKIDPFDSIEKMRLLDGVINMAEEIAASEKGEAE